MNLSTAQLGRRADRSDALDHAVRVGLVSYGVQHLLIAWLALQLAMGDRSGKASTTGALHELVQSGLGRASMYVVVAGFLALMVWQGLEAAVGHRDEDGAKRAYKRAVSAGKVVIYASLGYTALKIAVGAGSGGKSTDSWTATLLSAPGGQLLVVVVGLTVVGIGGALAWRGWQEKFRSKLDSGGTSGKDGTAYVAFGKAGYLSKGAAFAIIGGLFVYAGVTHDADKSAGLDQALQKLLQQPFGVVLLVLMAAGFAAYGLFCFAWARHLDR